MVVESGLKNYFAATADCFQRYGTIVQCLECKLVYTNPRPSDRDILRGYVEGEDQKYFVEAESRSINAYLSLHTVRRYRTGGRLLDIGCSMGFFLNAARILFDAHGVELSRWACDFAGNKLGINVRCGTLQDARFPSGHFDVVTLIDVIEHLPDPMGTMREIARIIKPGGMIYLVTPNIESLSAKLLRGFWWGFRSAHLYYFSPSSIRRLLEAAGFRIILMKSFGRIFTYRYWLSRIKNYPGILYKTVEALVKLFAVENKFLYLDTRDSMEIIAVAEDPGGTHAARGGSGK